MKKCKKCGAEISVNDLFCAQCGEKNKAVELKNKFTLFLKKIIPVISKYKTAVVAAVAVLALIVTVVCIYNSSHCNYGGCSNKTADDSDYCYEHKCKLCDSMVYKNDYCAVDYYLYSDDSPIYSSSMTTDLKISGVTLYSEYSYTYAKGTVTNYGTKTYDYVKVKGSFKNSVGTVVDTDWTYVVSSEGLAPGESKTFKLSVPKDYTIKNCLVTILDD